MSLFTQWHILLGGRVIITLTLTLNGLLYFLYLSNDFVFKPREKLVFVADLFVNNLSVVLRDSFEKVTEVTFFGQRFRELSQSHFARRNTYTEGYRVHVKVISH